MISEQQIQSMPAPPEGLTDVDRLAGAADRWANCPLRDCKSNPELLYGDFYLRGIRSDRLMCTACVVRVEMGYMAREEVKKADDRFFQGTQLDNAKTFAVMFVAGLLSTLIASFIPFFILPFFIGAAIGGGAAPFARRLADGRVTRQMHLIGAVGVVVGAFAISLFVWVSIFTIVLSVVGCGSAAWGILQRRI